MRPLIDRMRRPFEGAARHELWPLAGAMLASAAIVVVYVLATRGHELAGDETEYHLQGVFFTEGKLWWSTTPFGIEHASAWKAPVYPAWVGIWYSLLGASPLGVALVQALLAPLTVLLAWLLARRLFGPRVAIASAWAVSAFPLAWEYYGLLFPEALAVPLTMSVLVLVLGRWPTVGRTIAVGALLGASLLLRPSALFLLAAAAAAWILTAGWRRGLGFTALATLVAALVVVPWTVRNYVVSDGFIPISVQDGAIYGTFNEESANDPDDPYAWRPTPAGLDQIVDLSEPVSDAEFRSQLQSAGLQYIAEHPASVPKAFFWNGVSRFWDLRPPGDSLAESEFQSRSRTVRAFGLGVYYLLLPLALVGLWRLRGRREIAVPIIVMALTASLAFTIVAATRYRAPLEPLIAVLACSLLAPVRRDAGDGEPDATASGRRAGDQRGAR